MTDSQTRAEKAAEHKNTSRALCPRCGHDTFGIEAVGTKTKAVCKECGWPVDVSDLESLRMTPQHHHGDKMTDKWRVA